MDKFVIRSSFTMIINLAFQIIIHTIILGSFNIKYIICKNVENIFFQIQIIMNENKEYF
jgi:hypothetical protein